MPMTKEIAMQNRRLGDAFEFRQLRKLKRSTIEVARSSGSHGMFDLWALQKDKLRLIQCKRNGYMKIKERKAIMKFLSEKPGWVQVEVHIYKTPRKIKKYIIKRDKDLDKLNKVTR